MLNRILYWFITLPVLGKAGCMTSLIIVFACSGLTLASIPVARARQAVQATQTTMALQSQATQVAVSSTMTSIANTTATALVQQASTVTSIAEAQAVTATGIAVAQIATQTAVVAPTATAQANIDATNLAVAAASATSQAAVSATNTAIAATTATAVVARELEYQELASYEAAGKTWKNIIVIPEIRRESLILLGQQLHSKEPTSSYHLFNDKSQFEQFKKWDSNYGKVRTPAGKIVDMTDCPTCESAFPYPEEWVSQHHLADIQQMADEGELKWQLIFEDGSPSVDLDGRSTEWGGVRKDGVVTRAEADGWASSYLKYAQENFDCCVVSIEVVNLQDVRVMVTLKAVLADKSEEARKFIANALMTNFGLRLSECLTEVDFQDTNGRVYPDSYINNKCS